jgi:hypothetical protein
LDIIVANKVSKTAGASIGRLPDILLREDGGRNGCNQALHKRLQLILLYEILSAK